MILLLLVLLFFGGVVWFLSVTSDAANSAVFDAEYRHKQEIERERIKKQEPLRHLQKHKAQFKDTLQKIYRDVGNGGRNISPQNIEAELSRSLHEAKTQYRLLMQVDSAAAGAETKEIIAMENTLDLFRKCGSRFDAAASGYLLDGLNYGKVKPEVWKDIRECNRNDVLSKLGRYSDILSSTGPYDEIFNINPYELLKYAWFFATEKPYSPKDFNYVCDIYRRIHGYGNVELDIAGDYAKKQVGGEDALREPIRILLKHISDNNLIKNIPYTVRLRTVASGFMWMGAYNSENTILQYMLSAGMEMDFKMQERLHMLSNINGKAPNRFDVSSSATNLYFDVSALEWKADEYTAFFENLAFRDKVLEYSLAVRDENKSLFVAQNIGIPTTDLVLRKFEKVFAEEYEEGVVARPVNCIVLSGGDEEKMDGILVSSNECKQMAILIHIAKIGKKLIIKFYTLFMPVGSELADQKQQALSLCKNLSPSVAMWEGSLKDTMLMAVEQLLNSTEQSPDGGSNTAPSSEELIF